ncbi:hypothetical protein PVK06_026385 [Gossypium arboreum]|uniref:Uncharacterized protein n=1 Tax=Gossypium arboreum TaxID=29729 RepID=A0ABR0NXJ9_GOSAR|nr:hypothetical protein PVK06_026385 [Gossypium arboreum]
MDEAINHMVDAKQVKNIRHQIVDEEFEAEVEVKVEINSQGGGEKSYSSN